MFKQELKFGQCMPLYGSSFRIIQYREVHFVLKTEGNTTCSDFYEGFGPRLLKIK